MRIFRCALVEIHTRIEKYLCVRPTVRYKVNDIKNRSGKIDDVCSKSQVVTTTFTRIILQNNCIKRIILSCCGRKE